MDLDETDSDFYGDDDVVAELKQRVKQFDAEKWRSDRQQAPSSPRPPQEPLQSIAGSPKIKKEEEPFARQLSDIEKLGKDQKSPDLHNPYQGHSFAWQLSETLEDFFARLPPSTTDASEACPWIYICNPYVPRKRKAEAQNQMSRGNEDEGPEEEGSNLKVAVAGGMERLYLLTDFIKGAMAFMGGSPAVARDINEQRRDAVQNLLDLAWACKVRCGKWMLFISPQDVNRVWEVVATATANNELGIAAKVAPRDTNNGERERLICVYTADFKDKRNVGRVLERLKELRLLRGKVLYYKPDIFTYIGIGSGNPWGIRASIYSSKDDFPSA